MTATTAIPACKRWIHLFLKAVTLGRPSIRVSFPTKRPARGVWQHKVKLPKPGKPFNLVRGREERGLIISSAGYGNVPSAPGKRNKMLMTTIASSENLVKVAWGTCTLPGRGHLIAFWR